MNKMSISGNQEEAEETEEDEDTETEDQGEETPDEKEEEVKVNKKLEVAYHAVEFKVSVFTCCAELSILRSV